ncbi:HAD family hydrolase [Peptostreptococcus canis]|uniref:HAD family hydrolase n=1 Tax=Peptostreptococcus canis TaxID=1159213 RepID=A0ABR6TL93_9FIRM|nr:HAD family hydrolase [Peptostreptococcus canis]MBC2575771.1 HAD family hydrolase [Peptostreptococcus canis]MBP1998114.1 Cof subfamily protein (haloacid dehalogenase superfamily) [Peptostreptococcus canis]
MIKHIFSDLDGTLFSDRITEKDLQAIKIAQDNGIQFSIATGRVYSHSVSIIENTDLNGYLICENGSYIFDPQGDCIFKGTMKDAQIKKLINIYESLDYIDKNKDIIYFKYAGKIVIPVKVLETAYLEKGYTVDEEILEKNTYDDLVGNLGIMSNDKNILEKLVNDYKLKVGQDFDVYISSENTMNIVPKGISKFDAIKHVCRKEGISLDEVVTIGDSPNDISMLKNVKISFAMSNSIDCVKSVAGYETPSVADAVKMIIDLNSELD